MSFARHAVAAFFASLIAGLAHGSPIRMDVYGPMMSFDADTRVFSVTGAALARSEATVADPDCSGLGFCITGFQTLTALIAQDGSLINGTYTFVGEAPLAGLPSQTLLLSATIDRVGLDIREGLLNENSGAFFMDIAMSSIAAHPIVGDPTSRIHLWGEMYYPAFGVTGRLPTYGFPLTRENQWTHSWGVLMASDYSSIDSFGFAVPEPSSVLLVLLMPALLWASQRRTAIRRVDARAALAE